VRDVAGELTKIAKDLREIRCPQLADRVECLADVLREHAQSDSARTRADRLERVARARFDLAAGLQRTEAEEARRLQYLAAKDLEEVAKLRQVVATEERT
jgi:hypothetical protein